MGGNDFHARKVTSQRIKVNRSAIIQRDPTATFGIRSEDGKADMEHHRLAARLENLPDRIQFPLSRVESLVGRVEFETKDFDIASQVFRVTSKDVQIFCVNIQRPEYSRKSIGKL